MSLTSLMSALKRCLRYRKEKYKIILIPKQKNFMSPSSDFRYCINQIRMYCQNLRQSKHPRERRSSCRKPALSYRVRAKTYHAGLRLSLHSRDMLAHIPVSVYLNIGCTCSRCISHTCIAPAGPHSRCRKCCDHQTNRHDNSVGGRDFCPQTSSDILIPAVRRFPPGTVPRWPGLEENFEAIIPAQFTIEEVYEMLGEGREVQIFVSQRGGRIVELDKLANVRDLGNALGLTVLDRFGE
jgi:hypothetical protein